jgi:hypothetical protein
MHKHKKKYEGEENINPNPKTNSFFLNLDFQIKKQYLHEIKKLTGFGFVLMSRFLNKIYSHFTLHIRAQAHT